MPDRYKTPGVYIEEISIWPPSIAPVETAIPAFIGYTEKATRNGESLFNKPTRIESIAEYVALFGGAPSQDVSLFLGTNNQFVRAVASAKLFLYDSLRMFYANGGGKCYIVSVGAYPDRVSSATLEAAIALLEREDEPTIIIAPDAVSDTNGPYEFQKKALAQCQKLMDRVTICDVKEAVDNTTAFQDAVIEFRDKIGIDYLKYGAAYGPWLRVSLPRTLLRRNLILKRDNGGAAVPLSSLTSDVAIQNLIADLLNVESFVNTAATVKTQLSGDPAITLEERLKTLFGAHKATTAIATASTIAKTLKVISDFTVSMLKQIQLRYAAAPIPATNRFKVKDNIDNYIASSRVKAAIRILADHHDYLQGLAAADRIALLTPGADLDAAANFLGFTDGNTLMSLAPPPEIIRAYAAATTAKQRGSIAVIPVLAACNEAIAFFHFLESTQNSYEKTLNDALLTIFSTYKELMSKAADALSLLPPSGAIAGVYAAVDRERGVWKAPANVSLNAVVGPAVKITDAQQDEYNVDPKTGKSINIIRSFMGKGTLVWGARTLAGNDNEWRYISVRRFFNFVEESCKKATEQFVFEPNDANTWVRVQAMIENFLITLWRQGALQGVKPEHAFYVAVGLGKTMTASDILEGRMIVEIGMATVRSAEFIILRFSHKMAES